MHYAGNHIFFFFKILIVNNASFFFPDFLQDDVFRVLGGDTSKFLGLDFHMDDISHLCPLGNFQSILQRDLQAVILHFLMCRHNLFFRVYKEITGFPVDFHFYVIRFSEVVLARCKQRIFYCFEKCLFADFFFLFQNIQRFH